MFDETAHWVFDGVVDDQVVAAERKPRSHRHKVSVLQRTRTFPCGEHTHSNSLKNDSLTLKPILKVILLKDATEKQR